MCQMWNEHQFHNHTRTYNTTTLVHTNKRSFVNHKIIFTIQITKKEEKKKKQNYDNKNACNFHQILKINITALLIKKKS